MAEDEKPDFGREWAVRTTCCSKPVGCTNMSSQCLMRNHPWKRRNNLVPTEPDAADTERRAKAEVELRERFKDIA